MKFTIEQACNCGGRYVFSAYGDANFETATCTKCGQSAHLTNPLSVSVTAERLLYRSKAELESGEHGLSIVIAVMAIESFLTRLYLKLKGLDSYASTFMLLTGDKRRSGNACIPEPAAFQVRFFCPCAVFYAQ